MDVISFLHDLPANILNAKRPVFLAEERPFYLVERL
ncbi:MAG: hypothetical protein ACI819_001326, partial [Neolewinella sp.]